MRIEVTGKHLEVTPAIEAYATSKCERFTRFYDGTQQVKVLIDQQPRNQFEVELCVDAEKHSTFVSKQDGSDLYACIDGAVEKMIRQLSDFKEKLKQSNH
jgi:putative sigma-54 modulation protein